MTTAKNAETIIGPYIDATFDLDRFVELCWNGLDYALHAPRVTELMRESALERGQPVHFVDDLNYEKRLEQAKKLEEFGQEQKKNGFQFLYGIAASRLWAVLESMANDVVFNFLLESPTAWLSEPIKKLKGPLIEFVQASAAERAAFLMQMLTEEIRAKFKPGVGRFEAVLKAIGLTGAVHADVRRTLLELSEIRNVVIHRNSLADTKLVQACPWLNFNAGERVYIRPPQFRAFVGAAHWYMLELWIRWDVKMGTLDEERGKKARELMKDIELGLRESLTSVKGS